MYTALLACACLAAAPASATFTAGVSIELVVPPRGAVNLPDGGSSDAPLDITGRVTGLPGGPGLWKGAIYFYGSCGIWWDKGHGRYNALADRATVQSAMVPIAADGSFTVPGWSYKASDFDVLSPVIAFFVLPKAKDMSWPAYSSENIPIRDDIWIEAASWLFVDRAGCPPGGAACAPADVRAYVAQQPAAFPQVLEYPASAANGGVAGACEDGPRAAAGLPAGTRGAPPGVPYPAPPPGFPVIPGGPVTQDFTLNALGAQAEPPPPPPPPPTPRASPPANATAPAAASPAPAPPPLPATPVPPAGPPRDDLGFNISAAASGAPRGGARASVGAAAAAAAGLALAAAAALRG